MVREKFSIGALYNITENQHNPIKTVGRDSFLSPQTRKNVFTGSPSPQGSHSPYILEYNLTQTYNMCPSLIEIGSKTAEKNSCTNKQTDRQYENNGHLAVNQHSSACKRVLNLLEVDYLRRMKVVVMRITVVGFGMNSGVGCHTGCCEIDVKADTTKLTNVAIQDSERGEIWSEKVRCSSKMKLRLRAKWMMCSEKLLSFSDNRAVV